MIFRRKQDKPAIIKMSVDEKEQLLTRIQDSSLGEEDKYVVSGVIQNHHWLFDVYERGKLTMHKLQTLLFGKKTEKQRQKRGSESVESKSKTHRDAANNKRKGHGRTGANDYKNKTQLEVAHPTLKPGDPCPESPCTGRLYSISPGSFLHVKGQGLADVTQHILERLRCSACGIVVKAPLDLKEKYDAPFKAHLVLQRYFLGVPMHRQMAFQKMQGVPLADATQWCLMESVAGTVIPVFRHLAYLAAQGKLIQNDDTSVKILSLMKDVREDGRKGMYTTGIVGFFEHWKIMLFYSGRNHSGENLDRVLEQREAGLAAINQMCDALSMNLPGKRTNVCHCLAHARRKFVEVEHLFQAECSHVIRLIGEVYHHESQAVKNELSPAARLEWHQKHSESVMEELHDYLSHVDAEPNSALGGAIQYTLKHWKRLTQFLVTEGIPLDNNETERGLKLPIRSRKNSLFYKTEYSAQMSAILISIIQTCHVNEINPLDYLVRVQQNSEAVLKNPSAWLPWMEDIPLKKAA